MMRFLLLFVFICFVSADSISGIYVLPKDSKGKEAIVEVFERDGKFYGFSFATKNGSNHDLDTKNPDPSLRGRFVSGSVFLSLSCKDSSCNGEIYSFERGKKYPVKAHATKDSLEIRVDGFFGPTFSWKRLDENKYKKYRNMRLDTERITTNM